MKVLFLTRYGPLGASSRMRVLQFISRFEEAGIDCVVSPLIDDIQLRTRYRDSRYRSAGLLHSYWARIGQLLCGKQFDLVWIEKEALPWLPAAVETALLLNVPYVLDFDDATFHNYDLHASALVRRFFGKRIDRLMRRARLVVAGNSYLAQRAIDSGAPWVEVVPTVVDLDRYSVKQVKSPREGASRIVWIGSPSTVPYLHVLREPLAILSERFSIGLRVIGGDGIQFPGVDIEFVKWSEHTEAESIRACDIGVMPLFDSPWERGKCGYKLIQYMACGLPVVASGVGVNREIVRVGENGFVADTSEAWVDSLGRLLGDAALRLRMGSAGRQRVEEEYCVQRVAPKLVALLRSAAERV